MRIRAEIVLLVLVLTIGAFYWNVTLKAPIAFGDEGFYSSMAERMLSDGIIPKWNVVHSTDIFRFTFARPPVFFMVNMAALALGGEFLLKLLLPLPILLSSVMLFLLLRRFEKPVAGIAAAVALLLIPGMVTYGVLNYVETLSILFITLSLYFADAAFRKGDKKGAIFAGIFAGLALLTEVSAFWLLPILVGYALLVRPLRLRQLLVVLGIAALFLSPWLARNILLLGGHCYIPAMPDLPGACQSVLDVTLETGAPEAASPASGVGLNLSQLGIISYASFAFGWSVAAVFMFGLASMIVPSKARLLTGLWLLAFFAMTLIQLNAGRVEDTVRNTLFGFPALAMSIGLFASSAYAWLAAKKRWIALILVGFLLVTLVPYGYEKIVTMQGVKHNLDGLVDACGWVRSNTPTDSIIYVIYEHPAAWNCRRSAVSVVPDRTIIHSGQDANASYSHLKLHGFDYVIIEQFTISNTPYGDATPVAFVNMLESNTDKFKKVYDNTARWGQAGVRVYQVL